MERNSAMAKVGSNMPFHISVKGLFLPRVIAIISVVGLFLALSLQAVQAQPKVYRATQEDDPTRLGSYQPGITVLSDLYVIPGIPEEDKYEPGDSEGNPEGIYFTLWEPFTRLITELNRLLPKTSAKRNLWNLNFSDPLLLPYIHLLVRDLYHSDEFWTFDDVNYSGENLKRWRLTLESRLQQHGISLSLMELAKEPIALPGIHDSAELSRSQWFAKNVQTGSQARSLRKNTPTTTTRISPRKESLLYTLADEFHNIMTAQDIWQKNNSEPPKAGQRIRPENTKASFYYREINKAPNDPFHIKSFVYLFRLALYSELIPREQTAWLKRQLRQIKTMSGKIFTLKDNFGDLGNWEHWLNSFPTPEILKWQPSKTDSSSYESRTSDSGSSEGAAPPPTSRSQTSERDKPTTVPTVTAPETATTITTVPIVTPQKKPLPIPVNSVTSVSSSGFDLNSNNSDESDSSDSGSEYESQDDFPPAKGKWKPITQSVDLPRSPVEKKLLDPPSPGRGYLDQLEYSEAIPLPAASTITSDNSATQDLTYQAKVRRNRKKLPPLRLQSIPSDNESLKTPIVNLKTPSILPSPVFETYTPFLPPEMTTITEFSDTGFPFPFLPMQSEPHYKQSH